MTYARSIRPREWASLGRTTPLLTNLDIELTERCNNRCIHCSVNLPANDEEAKARELNAPEIIEILREAAALGCLSVRFTGGEPLIRQDFEELYLAARRLGLKVILFTNATLITARLADVLAKIPAREPVKISLYGMTRESYESVSMSPGSFEAAWAGIKQLQSRSVPFMVKSAVLPQNIGELETFEAWAATIPWMNGPPFYTVFLNLRHRRDLKDKNAAIRRLRPTAEQGIAFFAKRGDAFIRGMREFCSKFMVSPGTRLFTCGAGYKSGCVDAYGRFQLCLSLRHPATTYDLRSGTLRDALQDFFPMIRTMKAENSVYLSRCARCFICGFCEQCPAKAWIEHGTLDTPVEYHCEIAHVRARYLGLLDDGEKAWEVRDGALRLSTLSASDSPEVLSAVGNLMGLG